MRASGTFFDVREVLPDDGVAVAAALGAAGWLAPCDPPLPLPPLGVEGVEGVVVLPPPPPSGSWYWLSPALCANDAAGTGASANAASRSTSASGRKGLTARNVSGASEGHCGSLAAMPTASSEDFGAALAAVAGVEGWMTDDQARRLWERASEVRPPASIVEIGSYRGRSAIVLARAAAGSTVFAIDPHAGNDRGPQQIEGTAEEGQTDHEAFVANLGRGGVSGRVRHVRQPSSEAHGAIEGDIALLYVDGAHRYGPARDDIRDWGARVAPGGTMLIHDGFSSVGVTLATLRLLAFGSEFTYIGRSGSLVEYRRTAGMGAAARRRNALRQLGQLGWFARNLVVKVAIVAHITPLARLVGHRSRDWPY